MLQKCHDFRRLAHSLLSKLSHIPHIWFNNQMSCMKGSLLLIAKHWTPQCFSLIIPPGLTLWRLFFCLFKGVIPLCSRSSSICKSSFFPFLSFFFFFFFCAVVTSWISMAASKNSVTPYWDRVSHTAVDTLVCRCVCCSLTAHLTTFGQSDCFLLFLVFFWGGGIWPCSVTESHGSHISLKHQNRQDTRGDGPGCLDTHSSRSPPSVRAAVRANIKRRLETHVFHLWARDQACSVPPSLTLSLPLTFSSALLWHSVLSSVRVSLSAVTQQLHKPSRSSSSAHDDVG